MAIAIDQSLAGDAADPARVTWPDGRRRRRPPAPDRAQRAGREPAAADRARSAPAIRPGIPASGGWLAAPSFGLDEPLARTESSAAAGISPHQAGDSATSFDPAVVMETFAAVLADPPQAMQVFFAQLFAGHPEIRAIFPLGMAQTRAAVFDGLARLIWILDCPREFEASLRRIAATHRKYGVRDKHIPVFFAALVKTVELVSGRNWTAESARAWHGLAGHMTEVMVAESARSAAAPPWWVGEIVRHDRRSSTVAVLTIKPDQPLEFRAGQFLAVQVPRAPRVWRNYSIANAPRDSGLIDLHIRAVPGGLVSTALVIQAAPGDALILGPPAGSMLVPADPDRQVVCVVAGTGLAPVKAIIEEIASDPWQRRRQIALYLGGRDERDFYDMPDLLALRSAYPSLTIIPACGPGRDARAAGRPMLDAVRAHPGLENAEIYLSGPARLVSDLVRMLDGRVKPSAVHHDPIDQLAAASGSAAGPGPRR